jgi:hypothetical protein
MGEEAGEGQRRVILMQEVLLEEALQRPSLLLRGRFARLQRLYYSSLHHLYIRRTRRNPTTPRIT